MSSLPRFPDREALEAAASNTSDGRRQFLQFRPMPDPEDEDSASAAFRELSLRKHDRRASSYCARSRRQAEGSRTAHRPAAYHYVKEGKGFRERLRDKFAWR